MCNARFVTDTRANLWPEAFLEVLVNDNATVRLKVGQALKLTVSHFPHKSLSVQKGGFLTVLVGR